MTDSRKPITNRNYLPILSVSLGILDLDKSYHEKLERFLIQSDKQIEKCCKAIKENKGEEFGDFSQVSKALGI